MLVDNTTGFHFMDSSSSGSVVLVEVLYDDVSALWSVEYVKPSIPATQRSKNGRFKVSELKNTRSPN